MTRRSPMPGWGPPGSGRPPKRPGLHQRPAEEGGRSEEQLLALVRLALSEDVGSGDATTLAVVPPEREARAMLLAKEPGVLSGLRAARAALAEVDPRARLHADRRDGETFEAGETVLRLEGRARSLLTVERVVVNFLQQLSGIATLTRAFVREIEGTGVTIVDTRKTTPGFRFLEKEAVVHGGGGNHRLGLYDAFMIKDNHILAAGGISAAVERVRRHGPALPLVVEARTRAEVREVAALEVDQILLDNMDPDEISWAVATIRLEEQERNLARAWIEVSGGVTLGTVRRKAVPGVDLISVGALTHSARAVDLSLDLSLDPAALGLGGGE